MAKNGLKSTAKMLSPSLVDVMRNLITIIESTLLEQRDPGVVEWLDAARARSDANLLYVHGSNHKFANFQQPDTDIGALVFASKLTWLSPDRPLQAESYGRNLYLVKIHFKKRFIPNKDPVAKEILSTALDGEYRWEWSDDGEGRIYRGVWDFKRKMEYGELDYQDCHRVIPPAVEAGYDFFEVYECSVGDSSVATSDANIVEIVDRYPA